MNEKEQKKLSNIYDIYKINCLEYEMSLEFSINIKNIESYINLAKLSDISTGEVYYFFLHEEFKNKTHKLLVCLKQKKFGIIQILVRAKNEITDAKFLAIIKKNIEFELERIKN